MKSLVSDGATSEQLKVLYTRATSEITYYIVGEKR